MYLGVVGYPIKHSVSPAMHNAALKALNIEGIYLPFEVKPYEFGKAILGAKALGFKGLNITIPYKEEVLKFVRAEDVAAKIDAVNTVDLTSMLGYNTDVYGAIRALEENGIDIEDKISLVVGAGGAGKAVAFGLIERGSTVIITNRTADRGMKVAESLRRYGECIFYPYNKIEELKGKIDIIVNATPLGMKGFEIRLPIPATLLDNVVVFDTVYNPPETLLIREAKKRGCKVVYGLDMLVYQGAEAFKIWTGFDPPIKIMKEAAKSAL